MVRHSKLSNRLVLCAHSMSPGSARSFRRRGLS
jgi:hypothetical protein